MHNEEERWDGGSRAEQHPELRLPHAVRGRLVARGPSGRVAQPLTTGGGGGGIPAGDKVLMGIPGTAQYKDRLS